MSKRTSVRDRAGRFGLPTSDIGCTHDGDVSDSPAAMYADALMLLTPADAALVLGLSPKRVCSLADEGKLPVHATTPRGWRLFRESDVEQLRAERAGR